MEIETDTYNAIKVRDRRYTTKQIIMEDLVLSVPVSDYGIIEALAARMGWGLRQRRTSIERFIDSCPSSPQMTDEEIANEVNAVRYGE